MHQSRRSVVARRKEHDMRVKELTDLMSIDVPVDVILESTGEVVASKTTEDHFEMFEDYYDREVALIDMWHNTVCIYIKEN